MELKVGHFENTIIESQHIWLLNLQPSKREAEQLDDIYRGIFKVAYMEAAFYSKETQVTIPRKITLSPVVEADKHLLVLKRLSSARGSLFRGQFLLNRSRSN